MSDCRVRTGIAHNGSTSFFYSIVWKEKEIANYWFPLKFHWSMESWTLSRVDSFAVVGLQKQHSPRQITSWCFKQKTVTSNEKLLGSHFLRIQWKWRPNCDFRQLYCLSPVSSGSQTVRVSPWLCSITSGCCLMVSINKIKMRQLERWLRS